MVMKIRLLVIAGSLLFVPGCAYGPRVPLAGIGCMAGGTSAALVAPPLAPLGALLGHQAGALIDHWLENTPKAREMDRQRQSEEQPVLTEQLMTGPLMTGPLPVKDGSEVMAGRPLRIWVDEMMWNGRLVAGHFEDRPFQ